MVLRATLLHVQTSPAFQPPNHYLLFTKGLWRRDLFQGVARVALLPSKIRSSRNHPQIWECLRIALAQKIFADFVLLSKNASIVTSMAETQDGGMVDGCC